MEPTVAIVIGTYTNPGNTAKGIRVELTNAGDLPIAEIKVEWVCEFETPQLVDSQTGITAHEIGRRIGFCVGLGESEGPLCVGGSRCYLLPSEMTSEICSMTDSLSPERYTIQLTMEGKEETAISGRQFGEFMRHQFPVAAKVSSSPVTHERMQLLIKLVGVVVEGGRGFKVYPPKEVVNDPTVLNSNKIVELLKNSKWWLKFVDGREEILSLPELMVLTYNLINIKLQFQEAQRHGFKSGNLQMQFNFAVEQLMTAEFVKASLNKIMLEGLAGRATEQGK